MTTLRRLGLLIYISVLFTQLILAQNLGIVATGDGPALDPKDPGVLPPKVLTIVDPEYPEWARKAHIQGTVRLTAVIGTDGRAHNVEIVKGFDPKLDENARKTVSESWRFKPGEKDGKPVLVKVTVEVNFRLY